MTAKEALREAIDGMTEAEAQRLLELAGGEHTVGPEPGADPLLVFLREWWADDDAQSGNVSAQLQESIQTSGGVRLRERHEW